MYSFCNRIFESKILRIVLSILLAVIFVIVPIEHRMITAQAALEAAVLIPVICAILVAMGITFGGVFLKNTPMQGANASWKMNIGQSLRALAQDIYENCPGIVEALATSFPGSAIFVTGAKQICQIAPLAYQLIKKYLISKYENAEGLEEALNGSSVYFNCEPVMCGGYFMCSNKYYGSASASSLIGYPSFSIAGGGKAYSGEFELMNIYADGRYRYSANWYVNDSKHNAICITDDPSSLSFILFYKSIVAPDEDFPFGYCVVNLGRTVNDVVTSWDTSLKMAFSSAEEYNAAVGDTSVGSLQIAEVDKELFENQASVDYPRYLYVTDTPEDYIGQTAADVAAPAYSDIYESHVVDSTARTVTWQGDRTLCPIDELQSSLPTAVIGHWVATWDELSNLANISCYADDGTLTWSGEIATTLTWSDVLAKLGDIAITGPIAGTITGTATGSFAVADTALDFEPLKIAGETFSKKFPFCLPFDLYRAFLEFNVQEAAEAPVFKLPLNFGDQFGTHYIIIDMNEWTSVANIVKWCTYISFMVSLIVVTKKIMGGS